MKKQIRVTLSEKDLENLKKAKKYFQVGVNNKAISRMAEDFVRVNAL